MKKEIISVKIESGKYRVHTYEKGQSKSELVEIQHGLDKNSVIEVSLCMGCGKVQGEVRLYCRDCEEEYCYDPMG